MFAASKTAAAAAGTPPPSTDPQFNYVTMLLHGDGTNGAQNNTFVDSSTNNFTITRNGTPTQGSFSPYGDLWGNFFSGSGQYLKNTTATVTDFGAGNFTVEYWVYPTTTNSTYQQHVGSATTSTGFGCGMLNTAGTIYATTISTGYDTGVAFALNVWTHIAWVRNGTTLTAYRNGVSIGSFTVSTNFNETGVGIGAQPNGAFITTACYLSNIRVVKGTALYTSAFTPSTTPLTAVSGTSLLTCQSNRFRDNSSNNFAITVTGTPSVQRFSPFDPAAEYSTSVIGGSGFFGGTNQYLTVPDNAALTFATGDWTAECWCYPTVSGTASCLFARRPTGGTFGALNVSQESGGLNLLCGDGSSFPVNITGTSMRLNAWNHVAAVRSGSTFTLYLNGASIGTATYSGSLNSASSVFSVGAFGNGNDAFDGGYIGNVRLVKGTAVYTTNFTPPTAPLTAITNTSLLLNTVNAGIFDNAMMNDLVTVGNAQVSTAVKKYGTGSMYFTSTANDFLTVPSNPDTNLGSGNFTFECWFYKVSNPSSETNLIWWNGNPNNSSSHSALRVQLNNNGTLSLLCSESGSGWQISNTSTTTYSNSVWNHVAAVRNGQTVTLYLNGVSVASGSLSSSTASLYAGTLNYINNMLFFTGVWKMIGYIDDLRITKGIARYTANFTPPTAAFPNN